MAVHLGVGPDVREAAEAVERLGDVDQHAVALAPCDSGWGDRLFPYLFAVPNERAGIGLAAFSVLSR